MRRFAVIALLLLPCACSEPTANGPVNTESQIEGTWVCDFDKTWDKSKIQFLEQKRRHNRRLLGRIAESGQKGDKWEAEVREEVRSLASGLTIEFQKDGHVRFEAESQKIHGKYKVERVTSSRVIVHIDSDEVGRFGFEVNFESNNQMHLKELNAGKAAPLYVMHRA